MFSRLSSFFGLRRPISFSSAMPKKRTELIMNQRVNTLVANAYLANYILTLQTFCSLSPSLRFGFTSEYTPTDLTLCIFTKPRSQQMTHLASRVYLVNSLSQDSKLNRTKLHCSIISLLTLSNQTLVYVTILVDLGHDRECDCHQRIFRD